MYPDAKVAAERATAERIGDRLLIARPGLIVGPGDPSDRFGYWPARLHQGGRVLTPSRGGRYVQVIDVDDLAEWIVRAGTDRRIGIVNAVGVVHTMDDFFRAARTTTGFEGELIAVDDDTLLAHDLHYWAGPRSLPLWLPIADLGFVRRDGTSFLATGGRLRPLEDTLLRTLTDEVERGVGRPRRSGITTSEEQEVLDAVR